MDVLADRVRPVVGVSYEGVPVLRRQRPTGAAVPAPVRPAVTRPAVAEVTPAAALVPDGAGVGGPVWVAAAVRRGVARQIVVHRADCWVIGGETGPAGALTTDDCRRMLAMDPQASACDVCDTREIQAAPDDPG
ncbi:DUF6233 domain-containing protein [Streptomyces xanthophaeus]